MMHMELKKDSSQLNNKTVLETEFIGRIKSDINRFLKEIWYANDGGGRYGFDGEVSARDPIAEHVFFNLLEEKLDGGINNPLLLAGLLAYGNGFKTVLYDGYSRFVSGGPQEQIIRGKLRRVVLLLPVPINEKEAAWINSIIAYIYFGSLPDVPAETELHMYEKYMSYLRTHQI